MDTTGVHGGETVWKKLAGGASLRHGLVGTWMGGGVCFYVPWAWRIRFTAMVGINYVRGAGQTRRWFIHVWVKKKNFRKNECKKILLCICFSVTRNCTPTFIRLVGVLATKDGRNLTREVVWGLYAGEVLAQDVGDAGEALPVRAFGATFGRNSQSKVSYLAHVVDVRKKWNDCLKLLNIIVVKQRSSANCCLGKELWKPLLVVYLCAEIYLLVLANVDACETVTASEIEECMAAVGGGDKGA